MFTLLISQLINLNQLSCLKWNCNVLLKRKGVIHEPNKTDLNLYVVSGLFSMKGYVWPEEVSEILILFLLNLNSAKFTTKFPSEVNSGSSSRISIQDICVGGCCGATLSFGLSLIRDRCDHVSCCSSPAPPWGDLDLDVTGVF